MCSLGLILMFVCVCCASCVVDMEAATPRGTCTYMDESCIRKHHVLKDFCTPVFCEVCSGSQEGKFEVGHMPRKISAIAHCYYRLELSQLL